MTAWYTYLQGPAHQELPERACPPSIRRPLARFPLCPEGGDVIRRPGQWVIGPGERKHKTSTGNYITCVLNVGLSYFVLFQILWLYLCLQWAQLVIHLCDSTAVETIWKTGIRHLNILNTFAIIFDSPGSNMFRVLTRDRLSCACWWAA